MATARATLLFGSYRRDDAANPEIILEAAAAVLAEYPPDVIVSATDPRTGIQAQPRFASWPPNPGELRLFCEELMRPRRDAARREKADAEAGAIARSAAAVRASAPSAAVLRERYGLPLMSRDDHRSRVLEEIRREDAARAASRTAAMVRANRIMLERMCAAAGEEVPASRFAPSPALRGLLRAAVAAGGGKDRSG